MKKVLLGMIATVGILAVPAVSLAASYEYVNNAGALSTINADTPDAALLDATDIAPHSGVILVTPATTVVTTSPVTTTTTVVPVTTTTTNGTDFVGTYMGAMSIATSTIATSTMTAPYATTTQETMTLTLSADGTASLATAYGNGASSVTDSGTWTVLANNQILVTFTGNGSSSYNPVHQVTFSTSNSNSNILTESGFSGAGYTYTGVTTFTKE